MAIAIDSIDAGFFDNSGTTTTFTLAHTCTGSNLTLVVFAVIIQPFLFTGITYNGVAMTLQSSNTTALTNEYNSYIFTLINPPTGTHNIVATSNSNIGGTSHQMTMWGASYTGTSQTAIDSSVTVYNIVSASPASVSTTVVASNCWITGFAADANGTTYTAGSGTTTHVAQNHNMMLGDSNGTVGTGTQTLNWATTATGDHQSRGVVSLAPSAAAGGGGNFLLFF